VYRFVVDLVEPLTLGFLCLFVATALLWRRRCGRRRRLAWMSVFLALVALSCTNLVGYPAAGSLEWMYSADAAWPDRAEAIVVLGSGIRLDGGDKGEAVLDSDSMFRCLRAIEVYRQAGPCPIVVSGGKISPNVPGPPQAEVMRDFLVKLGVAPSDVVVENASRTTYENAIMSRKLLKEMDIDRIVLVTDATHMYRSARCFRALGVNVTPAVCNCRAVTFQWGPSTFLPSSGAAHKVETACHEWVGIAWYWLRGRI
jgi:uncharacterized SAM-binding protein YcdF (DUF218 family)